MEKIGILNIWVDCARQGRGSPTLWSTYHEIKAILEAPVIEKRNVPTIYDDSRRIVDMTEINYTNENTNLFIGDKLIFCILLTGSNN